MSGEVIVSEYVTGRNEWLLKVAGSYVHYKSANILKMACDRNTVSISNE